MSRFEGLSGVSAEFYGYHHQPFGDHRHGHLFLVWADFPSEPRVDGRLRQLRLRELCAEIADDMNAKLGDDATNEGLANYLLRALRGEGCVRVEVVRYAEGLRAVTWERGALG